MPRNRVQHQKGLSDDAFERLYPNEEACRKAWFAWRWPEGFKCPRCAATAYCEIRERQLLQCRHCRYQASLIAGTVLQGTKLPMRVWFRAMHLLAQGKKGLSNIELGRRLGISTNAAWRIQHKLMQAMIERDRRYKLGTAGPRIEIDDAYIGGERTGEGTGRGRRGHTPFIMAVETSADGRPLHARLQVVRGFQTGETKRLKPNGYAPASRPEPPSSAMAASGFAVLPSSRASSTSATSPVPIVHQRATPRSAGRTLCSPISKTASWPPIVWSRPNICRATSAPSPGASTAGLS
jgi:transposase-like protein